MITTIKPFVISLTFVLGFMFLFYEIGVALQIVDKQRKAAKSNWGRLNRYQPMSLGAVILKRITDIAVALPMCLVVLPILWLVLGCIIKIDSKGPVFFKQKRPGLHGKDFTCYKFRSMYWNCEDRMATPDDARVTRVGQFIRKTHLDEIPQFFNVLIGDMSLVGPRPIPSKSLDVYGFGKLEEIRTLVRPGLTGYNQLFGRSSQGAVYCWLDMHYVQNLSWRRDIRVMLATLKFKDIAY